MKLGIMQPYFFPYAGYFSLIAKTDKWVVFDITQYTKKTWMNRNRILHPSQGWQYITVPVVKLNRSTRISEVLVSQREKSKTRILGQLAHYRRFAPYYNNVIEIVEEAFLDSDSDTLVGLNVKGIKLVCQYLDVPFDYEICSEAGYGLPEKMNPGEWALEISSILGASEYINPPSGEFLFSKEDFARNDIQLTILEPPACIYATGKYEFVNYLSILDVLMWNEANVVRDNLQ